MTLGQTVYTVNNVTNKVDSWTLIGSIHTKDESLLRLEKGDKRLFLPKRCVFESEFEAKFIAGSYQ